MYLKDELPLSFPPFFSTVRGLCIFIQNTFSIYFIWFSRLMHKIFYSLYCLLTLICAALGASYYLAGDHLGFYTNSDALYLPTLFKDIFTKHGSISDWYLTPAPYFFPDYFLFLGAYLSSSSPYYQIAAFAAIQITTFSLAVLFLTRQIQPLKKTYFLTSSIVVYLIWLAINYGSNYLYLLISAHHFGIILLSIINLGLWLKYSQQPNKKAYFYAILIISYLGALSDGLFIIQNTAPLALSIFISAFFKNRAELKSKTKQSLYILIAAILGYNSYPLVISHRTWYNANISLNNIQPNLEVLSSIFTQIYSEHFVFFIVLILFLLIFAIQTYYYQKPHNNKSNQEQNLTFFTIYAFLSILASLIFCLISALPVTNRYLIPMFVLPVISVFYFIYNLAKRSEILALSSYSLFAVSCIYTLTPKLKNGYITNYYPEEVACIDQALSQELEPNTTLHGIAGYWDAKFIQNWSKKDLILGQHNSDLTKYSWITSDKYFQTTYDFAIISDNGGPGYLISEEALVRINGAPKVSKQCNNKKLLIYPKYGLKTTAF
jgi:hypothetical protein